MELVRLELKVAGHSDWTRMFDAGAWTVQVPTDPPLPRDTPVRLDLEVGGWLVTLRGSVTETRAEPPSSLVALDVTDREKVKYLNGYLRGGLLNHRGKRRLPVRLKVTYGAIEGPTDTFTKDINEEGIFLYTARPLPETSQVHMLVYVPDEPAPLSLVGTVAHTIVVHDEEPPGMGIVFQLDDGTRAQLAQVVARLEQALATNTLPKAVIE